jgi:hypothetical protein
LQDGFADKDDSLAILLVDDADSGIDAAIKNGQLRAIFRLNNPFTGFRASTSAYINQSRLITIILRSVCI